jgi:hypothetical protein
LAGSVFGGAAARAGIVIDVIRTRLASSGRPDGFDDLGERIDIDVLLRTDGPAENITLDAVTFDLSGSGYDLTVTQSGRCPDCGTGIRK